MLTLTPLLIGILFLFVPVDQPVKAGWDAPRPDSPADHLEPERLVFLLQYLGTDYGTAVEDGVVVNDFEYQEMLDFSQIVLEEYRKAAPAGALLQDFQQLRRLIEQKATWDEVRSLSQGAIPGLSAELGVVSYPTVAPDLDRGHRLYEHHCSKCHGLEGDGRGPSTVESKMDPPPSSFQEERMNQLAPYQVFNAITFGVEGTEMPSHLEALTVRQRWDVAFHVMTLRSNFDPRPPAEPLPLSLRQLASHSGEELIQQLGEAGRAVGVAEIDHYRRHPPGANLEDLLVLAERKLGQGFEAYRKGNSEQAVGVTVDAYLEGVEPVEVALGQRDRGLLLELESRFSDYRSALRAGAAAETVSRRYARLEQSLKQAREALAGSTGGLGFVFLQSLVIIVREGIEAVLLLGLMATCLAAARYRRLQKYLGLGTGAGVLGGFLTWWAAQRALKISALQQEALEGITSLLAAGVLFSVCVWVIHRSDVEHWTAYMKQRAELALGTGSGLVLASAAFLAVYREAVETVLFYQALWHRHQTSGGAVLGGFGVGVLLLSLLVLLMYKFGLRIPLKQFFTFSSIVLGGLALIFAGYGIRELQAIGWIKETPLEWMFRFPLLEIRPTLEGCALQLGLLLSFLIGWFSASRLTRPATRPAPVP